MQMRAPTVLVEPVSAGRARYRWLAGSATARAAGTRVLSARAQLADPLWRRRAAKPLLRALLGLVALMVIVRLPAVEPLHLVVVTLLATWLCFASVLHQVALWLARWGWFHARAPRIPLRFDGSTGRFSLRRFDSGRKVVVTDGSEVVAEVIAADAGDEVVVYDTEAVTDAELDELGSAIGQAIEITVAAGARPVSRLPFE